MPIDPRLALVSISNTEGVAQRTADLARRVAKLEAVRTSIGDASIVGTQVQTGTLDASNLNVGSVTAAILTAGSINAGMIQANAIQTIHLDAQVVTAAKIAAGTITATQIAANTITAGQIAAGTITATEIAAGAVTAIKINVSNLAAISTDMGSISAGTITGGTIQSGTSGSRWVGDGTGIRGYALDGVTKTFEMNTGSGVMTVNGIVIAQPGSTLPAGLITGSLGGGNLLPNSSAENYPGGYTAFNGTLATETTNFKYGTKALKITATTTAPQIFVNSLGNTARVTPGTTITLSAWVKCGTTARQCQVISRFTDASGALLASGSPNIWNFLQGPLTNGSTTAWTRVTVTGVVPPLAVFSGIVVNWPAGVTGEVFYADGFQIEEADVASAYAPTPSEILPGTITATEIASNAVTSTKIFDGAVIAAKLNAVLGGGNLVYNSGFEVTVSGAVTNGWDGYTVTGGGTGVLVTRASDPLRVINGDKALKITATGAAQNCYLEPTSTSRFTVQEGQPYTASVWLGASTTSRSGYVGIRWRDATGTQISIVNSTAITISSTAMTRCTLVNTIAPVGAVTGEIRPVGNATGVLTGDSFYFDGMQVEMGEYPTAYAPDPDEILPNAVTASSIVAGAVVAGKIGALAVTAGTIAALAVTAGTIAANAVTATEIAAGAVTTAKMTAGTIDADRLTAGTVTSTQINAASVRTAILTAGSVTASTIAAGAIQAQHLSISTPNVINFVNGSFNDIVAGGVLPGWTKTGAGTLTSPSDASFGTVLQIAAPSDTYVTQSLTVPVGRHVWRTWVKVTAFTSGTVQAEAVLNSGTATITNTTPLAVVGNWVLFETVVLVTSATASIGFRQRVAGVATAQFANSHILESVTTSEIGPGTIVTGHITTGTLSGGVISAGTISATELGANAVTAVKILAGAITADKIGFRYAGTNFAKNSSFEQGIGNVTTNNSTVAIGAFPRTGANAVVATSAAAGAFGAANVAVADLITPTSGQVITLTAYVKAPTVARVTSILPQFYTSANAFVAGTVSGTAPTVISVTATTTTAYQRVQLTFPFIPGSNGVPATAAKLGWLVQAAGAAAAGEVIHIDDVQIEYGDTPSDWSQYIDPTVIDGSTITAPTIRTSTTNPRVQLDGTNGLSITDASGNIVSQMKASAGGLDLAVTSNTAPVDERKLRFTSGGVSYGDLLVGSGSWTGFNNSLRLSMSPPSSASSGESETLITSTHTGAGSTDQAQVRLYHTGSGQNGVQASAGPLAGGGSTQATILRDDGGSSYVIADQGGYISGTLNAPAGGGFNNAASAFSYALLRGSGFDANGAWTCARAGTYRITVHIDYQNAAANTTAAGDMLLNGVTGLTTTRIHNGVAASRVNGCGFFERAFAAGDVLQLRIAQTDATARNVGWRLGIERVV